MWYIIQELCNTHKTIMGTINLHITELFKQFMDNDGFKRWMTDTVFGLTYEERRV